jgi:ferritin
MPNVVQMLADHIASEEKASRTYRYFQSWCGLNGWPGTEAYFMAESKDELTHMEAFQAYVDDVWPSLKPPAVDSQDAIAIPIVNLVDCFTAALQLEKDVLGQLNAIGSQAVTEGNFDVLRFLQRFTEIGVNSIRELTTYVQQLKLAGSDAAALLGFDSEIGEEG